MTDLHIESCKAKQLSTHGPQRKCIWFKLLLFLDPGYDDVGKGSPTASPIQPDFPTELSTALSYLDKMKYYGGKQTAVSFSREEGRQLILAAKVLELLIEAFGPEDIKPIKIFNGASISS